MKRLAFKSTIYNNSQNIKQTCVKGLYIKSAKFPGGGELGENVEILRKIKKITLE